MTNIDNLSDRPATREHRVTLRATNVPDAANRRALVTMIARVGDLGPDVPVILSSGDGFKARRVPGTGPAAADALLAKAVATLVNGGWEVLLDSNTLA